MDLPASRLCQQYIGGKKSTINVKKQSCLSGFANKQPFFFFFFFLRDSAKNEAQSCVKYADLATVVLMELLVCLLLQLNSFYCYLCGKHSNSDRQWQQHIYTEKHKQRVFSGEGEEESLAWSYRFPGPCFSICPRFTIIKSMNIINDEGFVINSGLCLIDRLEDGCADGVSCDFAHSEEELQEWCKRRDFLRRTLHKARDENMISPNDNDFGILTFILQD